MLTLNCHRDLKVPKQVSSKPRPLTVPEGEALLASGPTSLRFGGAAEVAVAGLSDGV